MMQGSQHELKDKGNDGKKRRSEWQIRGEEQHPVLILRPTSFETQGFSDMYVLN
jgi:hypothetical protein